MDDFEEFIKKYGDKVEDEFWSIIGSGIGGWKIHTDNHGTIQVDVYVDTTHGLEGWYDSEITGTVETSTECYEFLIRDRFCCETEMEHFEKDEYFVPEVKLGDIPYLPQTITTPSDVLHIREAGTWEVTLSPQYTLNDHVHVGATAQPTTIFNFITTGENNMSNTEKKVANVILMDNDSNVPEEDSIIAKFTDVVYTGNEQAMLMQLCIDQDIKSILEDHNALRTDLINQTILERTGNKVYLRDITMADVTTLVS